MSGTALQDFADFVEATGPNYVTGPKSMVMEAVKNTYWFGRLIKGKNSKKKMLTGGSSINESIIFKDNGSAETYLPGESHDWQNPQRLKKATAYMRYVMAHMSWVEQEILENEVISSGTEDARFQEYVNLYEEKRSIMIVNLWNFLEDLLWQTPIPTQMESNDGTEPYSVPAFVNEDTNGLFDPQASAAFTTVEGLNPTDSALDSRWAPKTASYSTESATADTGIFYNLDLLMSDLDYEQAPTMQEYWQDPRYNKHMIVTSTRGVNAYKLLLRSSQDHFVAGPQDPAYNKPQYYGIPIDRASTLDTAALYDSGSSTVVAENTAANGGPRYYCLNAEYLYPCFHNQRYFHKQDVTKHHNVPDTWVMPIQVWYNLLCTSRQRQGILSPSVAGPLFY